MILLNGKKSSRMWRVVRFFRWRLASVVLGCFCLSACVSDVAPLFVNAEYLYSKYVLWFWLPLIMMFFQGLAIVILWVNVGHRKRIEAHLNIFHQALEQCPVAVLVVNKAFRVEFVNHAYYAESALTESQAVGKSVFGLRGFPFTQEECLNHFDKGSEGQVWRVEALCRWQDGSLRHHRFVMSAVRDGTGEISHYVILRENIDAHKRAEAQLVFQANYDALTELPNRSLLITRMREAIQQCQWRHHTVAVLFIDLNGFKKVNDQFGHAFGDRLLIQVSHRLLASVGKEGFTARIGGDEFGIVMTVKDSLHEAEQLAERIIEHVQSPLRQDGKTCFLSASIGIALAPHDADKPEVLLQYADLAMYASKAAAHDGGYRFYKTEMNQQAQRRVAIENGLRQAIERAEMFLVFQPVVGSDQQMVSCEVLIRWHQAATPISPNEFVPVAEQSGDIQRIGAWVMREACRHYQQWVEKELAPPQIAVNVSFNQLLYGDIVALVKQCFLEFPAVAGHLTLEMTERVFIDDLNRTNEVFETLKRLGCRLAIDDFGTGYSALSYLAQYPFDVVKIDRSFIEGLGHDDSALPLVSGIAMLAHALSLNTIVEGVETQAQWDSLVTLGIYGYQGFGVVKPQLGVEFLSLLYATREHGAVPMETISTRAVRSRNPKRHALEMDPVVY